MLRSGRVTGVLIGASSPEQIVQNLGILNAYVHGGRTRAHRFDCRRSTLSVSLFFGGVNYHGGFGAAPAGKELSSGAHRRNAHGYHTQELVRTLNLPDMRRIARGP
ncbi:MAG: hypothetical protein R2912_11935 [Eubacteriales bacterium]